MKVHFIFLLFITVFFISCKKNSTHPVPSIPFDVTINLNLPSYSELNGVGGYAFVAAGSKGVIVYRRGIDEFVAFDRHSPADLEGSCATPLTPDVDNFLVLNDICNDAKFSLYDGSPIQNSDFGLRQYVTVWNGSDQLRIFN
jgi:hypothetical protein